MKIAVCVKQAVDEGELKTAQDGTPILQGAATKVSTFDKNALEEAVRLKTAHGGEVVIFSVGGTDAKKTVKEALAMGCDRGVLVVADVTYLDALSVAEMLSRAIAHAGAFDLVLCSEGSSDIYTGEVPGMLAERLKVPYISYARKLEFSGGSVKAERALEDLVEVVEGTAPLVVSVVSEINEPRYPTLIQIMQASKKPIEEIPAAQLGELQPPSVRILGSKAERTSRKGVVLDGSPEEVASKLLDALAAEGVLVR